MKPCHNGGIMLYEKVKKDEKIKVYITGADQALSAIGYTEHSFQHVTRVAEHTGYILETLGYSEKEIDLGKVSAYLHDIGNVVNRKSHSQTSAIMAFRLLEEMDVPAEDIATIISAIGNHDEGTGEPINAISAALILADKADVRRSRVRNQDAPSFDIHDRVNYSVKESTLKINEAKTIVKLKLNVDTRFGSVMEYFEIFMERMIMCRKAANKLGLQFKLIINEQQLI